MQSRRQQDGRHIRVDAGELTYKKFLVLDQSATVFDGSAVDVLALASGTYNFRQPDIGADFTFEVTPDGFVNYSAANDSFLSGRGTSTLVVRGFRIGLDARTLSHDLQPFSLSEILSRERTHVLTLLPAKGYAFLPSSQFVGDFRFDVTPEGTINYDQGSEGFVSGRGSSQLVVGGFPITIAWKGAQDDQAIYFSLFDGNEFTGQIAISGVGTSEGPAVCRLSVSTHGMEGGRRR
jgi:hypothetical protein